MWLKRSSYPAYNYRYRYALLIHKVTRNSFVAIAMDKSIRWDW